MTQHPSTALWRAGCEAFAKRDLATLAKLFAEDVVGRVAGRNPFSGEHRGRAAWHPRSTNLSRALLARHREALPVLAARGISWCDWGDPDRILRSLRRFDRQPAWLPVNARAQAAMGVSMRKAGSCGKERDHAAV